MKNMVLNRSRFANPISYDNELELLNRDIENSDGKFTIIQNVMFIPGLCGELSYRGSDLIWYCDKFPVPEKPVNVL